MPKVGEEVARLFPEDRAVDLTPVLRKSKEAARKHRAKGGASKTGPLGGRGRVVRGRGRGGPGGEDRGRKRSRYEEGPGQERSKYPRYNEDRRGPPPPPRVGPAGLR